MTGISKIGVDIVGVISDLFSNPEKIVYNIIDLYGETLDERAKQLEKAAASFRTLTYTDPKEQLRFNDIFADLSGGFTGYISGSPENMPVEDGVPNDVNNRTQYFIAMDYVGNLQQKKDVVLPRKGDLADCNFACHLVLKAKDISQRIEEVSLDPALSLAERASAIRAIQWDLLNIEFEIEKLEIAYEMTVMSDEKLDSIQDSNAAERMRNFSSSGVIPEEVPQLVESMRKMLE